MGSLGSPLKSFEYKKIVIMAMKIIKPAISATEAIIHLFSYIASKD